MIINTGQRTDIPAFYTPWFVARLKAGSVLVRSPYDPTLVTRYRLTPDVVDLIGFCTKNPAPMLDHMDLLEPFDQYWHVTITPYGRDIEPHVPGKRQVLDSFRRLSDRVGAHRVAWRYDPILLSEAWPVERHIKAFEYMAEALRSGLFYNKACYSCRWRKRSVADIRIGDGTEDAMNRKSILAVMTKTGTQLINNLMISGYWEGLHKLDLRGNTEAITGENPPMPVFYEQAFEKLRDEKTSINRIMKEFVKPARTGANIRL